MAKAILESRKFAVRALTRDVTRPNTLVLQDLGAEVVKGNLNDEASVEAALKDACGAFVVTDFWDQLSKEKEVCQVGTPLSISSYPPWLLCPPLKRAGPQSGQKTQVSLHNISLVFMKYMYLQYLLEVALILKSEISVTQHTPTLKTSEIGE